MILIVREIHAMSALVLCGKIRKMISAITEKHVNKMKRNFPPDRSTNQSELDQIEYETQKRIEQLYTNRATSNKIELGVLDKETEQSSSKDGYQTIFKHVPAGNVGIYNPEKHIILLESLKGIDRFLVSHNKEANYHFLGPLEALYSMEMSKFLIYHNSIPLSLAEAYQLLLSKHSSGRGQSVSEYLVFRYLNVIGYVCAISGTGLACNRSVYNVIKRETLTKLKLDRGKLCENNADFQLVVQEASQQDGFLSNLLDIESSMRTIIALLDSDLKISFVEFKHLVESEISLLRV